MALYRKFSFCDPICFFLSLNNPSQVQYTSIREFSASSILLNLEIWRKVMTREIFQFQKITSQTCPQQLPLQAQDMMSSI